MPRIIEGQVITSTNLDLHGDRLSREDLEEMLASMPEQRLVNLNHDPLAPPVARAYNNRLEQLEDGEYAIRSDIEVLDEERFAQTAGVSISFTKARRDPDDEPTPQLRVSYNPRLVVREEIQAALSGHDALREEARLVERSEKSALAVVGVIFLWVTQGFWGEAGADVYRFAKALIRGEHKAAVVQLKVAIEIQTGPEEAQLIVEVDSNSDGEPELDPAAILAEARDLAPGNRLAKLVAHFDADGQAQITNAVDEAGTLFAPSAQ